MILDEDDVVLCGLAVDVHSVVVAIKRAYDVRFACLFVQGRRVGAFAAEFVMVVSEGDRKAILFVVADDIIKNELVETVDVVNEAVKCDACDESDGYKICHSVTPFVL